MRVCVCVYVCWAGKMNDQYNSMFRVPVQQKVYAGTDTRYDRIRNLAKHVTGLP